MIEIAGVAVVLALVAALATVLIEAVIVLWGRK